MKELSHIRRKLGDENPFRVPDGYFDNFATQLMDKLPERAPVSIQKGGVAISPIRRWLYAAACFCVVLVGATAYFINHPLGASDEASSEPHHLSISASELYEQEFADYAMMDNADIYAFLTDTSYE